MPDLSEDVARQLKQNRQQLVPNQGTTGHFLAVVGQEPFQFAFRQVPEGEIGRFAGSPDGELSAQIDSLVRNTDDHTLWINTDGETAWAQIGAGSATDPDSFDYLEAEDTFTNTGLTSDLEFPINFSVVGANTSGTDISIDGSDDIVINADGIYAAEFGVQVTSEVASDTFSVAITRLHVERAVRGDVELRDHRVPPMSDRHYSENAFAWTGFMHANDKFTLHISMLNGGADTWAGLGWGFVQRIA